MSDGRGRSPVRPVGSPGIEIKDKRRGQSDKKNARKDKLSLSPVRKDKKDRDQNKKTR